ncbi:MAG TPA: hypothetical protein VE397_02760 [Stellaceae bacterium]|jgi:hypothetical protein|nr:hypothetical protein [Stellaceae bacterium]
MAEAKKTGAKEAAGGEAKALRSRKVYLQVRMPKVREEIKVIGDERKTISEKLKNVAALDASQQKAVRERGVYLSHHHNALRAELKALTAERQVVGEKLRPARKKA